MSFTRAQPTEQAPIAAHQPTHRLNRTLSLWLLTFYGLGTIVGAGIYIVVGEVAKQAGMGTPLAFLSAGLIAACTGLAYAELAARFPDAAGAAAYVSEGLRSPLMARVTGLLVLATGIVIAASLARGAAGYLSEFVAIPMPLLSGLFVVLFTGIACLNVRESVGLAALLTIVELFGLLLVIAAGSPALSAFPARMAEMIPHQIAGWADVSTGAFLAFFAYIGFESLANMAEEAKNPERDLPRAILLSIAISSALYVSVAVVVVLAVPMASLIVSTAPLALVMETSPWIPAELLVVIALIAIPNGLLADLLMTARLLYGMGKRGLAPEWLAIVSAKQRIPVVATLTAGAATLIFAVLIPFTQLVSATSAMTLIVFLLVNLALWRLHRTNRHSGAIRAPRWMPPLAILFCLGLLLSEVSNWLMT